MSVVAEKSVLQAADTSKVYLAQGMHALADVRGANPLKLSDADWLLEQACLAARNAGATVLQAHAHPFGPGQGVAGVVLLAESHLTFHTWPEHGFAALDAFMCGSCDPHQAVRDFAYALGAQSMDCQVLCRGG